MIKQVKEKFHLLFLQLLLLSNTSSSLARSKPSLPLESHSRRGGETDGVGNESKEEVTGTHVQGWEGLTGTGSLHSPFPFFVSSLLICDS